MNPKNMDILYCASRSPLSLMVYMKSTSNEIRNDYGNMRKVIHVLTHNPTNYFIIQRLRCTGNKSSVIYWLVHSFLYVWTAVREWVSGKVSPL